MARRVQLRVVCNERSFDWIAYLCGQRRKVSRSSVRAGDDVPELPLPEVHAGALDPPLDPAVGISSGDDRCGRTRASEHVVAGEPQEAAGRIGDKNFVPYERLMQRLIGVRPSRLSNLARSDRGAATIWPVQFMISAVSSPPGVPSTRKMRICRPSLTQRGYTARCLRLVLHRIDDFGEEESHLRRDRSSWVGLLD